MTTTTETVTPVHIDLGQVPPLSEIPATARDAVTAWQAAMAEAESAALAYVAAIDTEGKTHAQRGYVRDRAITLGQPDPGAGPEAEALAEARATADRLRRLAGVLHDDEARALIGVADQALAELQADDRLKAVQKASAALVTTLERLGNRAPLIGFWTRLLDAPKGNVTHIEYGSVGTFRVGGTNMSVAQLSELLASIEAIPER